MNKEQELTLMVLSEKIIELVTILENNPSLHSTDALIAAVNNDNLINQIKLVKILLAYPNTQPGRALVFSAAQGNTELVQLLLNDKRINMHDFNNEAIISAALNGQFEVVKLLLNYSNNVKDAELALSYASNRLDQKVHKGHIDIVMHLQEHPSIDFILKSEALSDLFSKLVPDDFDYYNACLTEINASSRSCRY